MQYGIRKCHYGPSGQIGIGMVQLMSTLCTVSCSTTSPTIQSRPVSETSSGRWIYTKQEAKDLCKEAVLNQGQCIQFVREHPELGSTEEDCKEFFPQRI